MKIYKVTVIGAQTNAANRVIRYFDNPTSAQNYAESRSNGDTVTATIKALVVRD